MATSVKVRNSSRIFNRLAKLFMASKKLMSELSAFIAEELVIFTRYPQPGTTKTRMIPVLGEQGAADLQSRLTEKTLKTALNIPKIGKISLRIYFTGGNKSLMQQWLGENLIYQPQSQGDLGEKMYQAFKDAFERCSERVIIIGIDCPDLTEKILEDAFDLLKHHDLVLGPAVDGGYYLIGLSCLKSELFRGIDWGTSQVLQQTQEIAHKLGLSLSYLPVLHDIDRPSDLEYLKF